MIYVFEYIYVWKHILLHADDVQLRNSSKNINLCIYACIYIFADSWPLLFAKGLFKPICCSLDMMLFQVCFDGMYVCMYPCVNTCMYVVTCPLLVAYLISANIFLQVVRPLVRSSFCAYISMYVCMYVCMYACTYLSMCVCSYEWKSRPCCRGGSLIVCDGLHGFACQDKFRSPRLRGQLHPVRDGSGVEEGPRPAANP